MSGQKFARLTVIDLSPRTTKRKTWWNCICDCGAKCTVRADGLKNGHAQSCGCRQKEIVRDICLSRATHKQSGTRIYESWGHMISRCNNPNNSRYLDYGGRGIEVCKRWLKFANFFADMGEMPPKATLERRNNSKGYSKGNCYWASYKQQNRNRRNTLFVHLQGGRKISMGEYAERLNVPYKVAYARFKAGIIAASHLNMVR